MEKKGQEVESSHHIWRTDDLTWKHLIASEF
jgi:hypothetical protein